MIASNYDIETIYIDGLYKIINAGSDNLEELFKKLDNIGHKHDVDFAITISCDKEDLPEYLKTYQSI